MPFEVFYNRAASIAKNMCPCKSLIPPIISYFRTMICFPGAKINIGLNVINRRNDGYHDLETIFYPVQIHDILEAVEVEDGQTQDPPEIRITGLEVKGSAGSNLCVKALVLLEKKYPLRPVRMHLHKIIPMGAGLGGGSSNGAYTIKLIDRLFGLGISVREMEDYALELGSDCPFFIRNNPVFASGRGENFSETSVDLSRYSIVVVIPPVHVSTKEAFSGITPKTPDQSLKTLGNLPVDQWKNLISNDFEPGVFSKYPLIRDIKNKLYDLGAVYASMSGSGSAVYGIFAGAAEIKSYRSFFPGYEVFISSEKDRKSEETI
jgi:4-diphosphocytidyl-2-C-methyl-D-erythritol kinase